MLRRTVRQRPWSKQHWEAINNLGRTEGASEGRRGAEQRREEERQVLLETSGERTS